MAAFKKAKEVGAPGIELDTHCCATGELVVAHDDTFKRTAPGDAHGGGKELEALSLAEIRSIDVGSFFDPRFGGERPPLLEEALEEFCPALYIDIELKSRKTRGDPLPGLAAEKLKRLGDRVAGAVTVSSFNPFCIRAFKERCAELGLRIPTAAIWCDDPEVPWILRRGAGCFLGRADYAKPDNRQVNRFSSFRWAHVEGRSPVPWTIDDPALAERMLRLGCAGVITNRPQDILPLIRAQGAAFRGGAS
jgi:glycerophosphoryl diester phosphodiesterase